MICTRCDNFVSLHAETYPWCEDCEHEYLRDCTEDIWWSDTTPTYWDELRRADASHI